MRKACVLVIEQNEERRIQVTTVLQGAGYEVRCAGDTLEGLRRMFESYPDVIVMGSRLSDVSGKDARVEVRRAAYLPIVIIGDQSDAIDSLEVGGDAFLTAPPKPVELVARVRSLINRKMKLGNNRSNSANWENQN
jgi:DNA-binding response OmpR family regulator